MLDISEILDDPDFVQSVQFGILTNDVETLVTYPNTNVQPASGAALQRLPEAERTKPVLQVFTKSSQPFKNRDFMYFNGQKWRCTTEENWSQYGYYDGLFTLYNGAQDPTTTTPDPFA